MEAVSHKAVCKYFVLAPKFQMTHSDSVLAGIRPSSRLLEAPREPSAVTDYLLIALPCGRFQFIYHWQHLQTSQVYMVSPEAARNSGMSSQPAKPKMEQHTQVCVQNPLSYKHAKVTVFIFNLYKDFLKRSNTVMMRQLFPVRWRDSWKLPSESPPIIDFGKIIIYTNNLKIIRTPMDKRDFMRKILQKEEEVEEECLMSKEEIYGDSDHNDGPLAGTESTFPHNQYPQEGELPEDNCFHCRGSGSATCSLCHGSKFSMLANRFKESYRALRCPACNENGLQPCHICSQ
ncbi:glutaredoxin domain-containing cysteine-rich protein 2 isoform 2-T2 [Hipposideros larvatus]